MRHDNLSLMQEFVGDANALVEESTRILAQIKNEPFQIAKLLERILNFLLCRFIESRDVHIPDAGPDQEMQIHAVAWNLIAYHCELKRFFRALSQHRDVDRGGLGACQHVRDVAGGHVDIRFPIACDDDVSGPNSRAIRWCPHEWSNHNDLVVTGTDSHADTVVLAPLVLPQQGIG